MNMQENYRLIEALESAGWSAQEIVNLIKYVESGEEQYKPKKQENAGDYPRRFSLRYSIASTILANALLRVVFTISGEKPYFLQICT